MIRVVLVDDQTLVRQGVRGLLELVPDIEVVGEASDGEEALEKVPELKPDVLLLDIRMPRIDGIAVLQALAQAHALPPTLVLTTFDDGDAAIAAIKAGAKGLMLKDVSLDDLAQAIRALANDKTAFQPAMTESLMAAIRRSPSNASDSYVAEALTAREREVLHLICAGYSNKEIAELLALAEGTVKNHVSNLLLSSMPATEPGQRSRACNRGIWVRENSVPRWLYSPSINGQAGPALVGTTLSRSRPMTIRRTSPGDVLAPCRCCGGRMVIYETFEQWWQPRALASPAPTPGTIQS